MLKFETSWFEFGDETKYLGEALVDPEALDRVHKLQPEPSGSGGWLACKNRPIRQA
jgi:hypothetical protein